MLDRSCHVVVNVYFFPSCKYFISCFHRTTAAHTISKVPRKVGCFVNDDKYGAEWLKSKNAQITHNLLLIWCAAESPWLPRDHPQFPETPRESRHLHPGGLQGWQKAARVPRTLPLQSPLVNPVNPRRPLFPPLPQEKVSWAGAGGVDSMRAG